MLSQFFCLVNELSEGKKVDFGWDVRGDLGGGRFLQQKKKAIQLSECDGEGMLYYVLWCSHFGFFDFSPIGFACI